MDEKVICSTSSKRVLTAFAIAFGATLALLGCDGGTFLKGFVRDSEGRMMPNALITLIVSRILAKLSRCKTARTMRECCMHPLRLSWLWRSQRDLC